MGIIRIIVPFTAASLIVLALTVVSLMEPVAPKRVESFPTYHCERPYQDMENGCCLDINYNGFCDIDEAMVRSRGMQ